MIRMVMVAMPAEMKAETPEAMPAEMKVETPEKMPAETMAETPLLKKP